MRSVMAAVVVTSLWMTPGLALAQEPEAQPAPAPQPAAVPRSERMAPRDSAPRTRDAEQTPRGSSGATERVRTREAQPVRAETPRTTGATQAERRRAPVSTPAVVATDEQQGGGAQRRGTVRRPSDESRSGSRDRAVPRTSAPRSRGPIYVYPDYRYYNRYYDPWGYGGFGLGYFYYSPWAWSPGYYGGYGSGGRYQAYGYDLGSVKLKVKPRDAEVFVDGYYAGLVDDFDGMFQALKLDSGAYRIEIRKPGHETLHFDVRVQPDRTITFRGELRPVP